MKITLLWRLLESPLTLTSPILLGSLSLASREAWEGSTIPLSQTSTSKSRGENDGSTWTPRIIRLKCVTNCIILGTMVFLLRRLVLPWEVFSLLTRQGCSGFVSLLDFKEVFHHTRDCFNAFYVQFIVHATGKCQSTTCLSAEVWMKHFVWSRLSSLWRRMGR